MPTEPRPRLSASGRALVLVSGLALAACAHARDPVDSGAALRIVVGPGDDDADLFVDGAYVGTVGEVMDPAQPPLRLGPGRHAVEVRKPGRVPVQRTITVGRPGPAAVELAAELIEPPP